MVVGWEGGVEGVGRQKVQDMVVQNPWLKWCREGAYRTHTQDIRNMQGRAKGGLGSDGGSGFRYHI